MPDNSIDPPYRLDPFQNIINIHWSGGEPGSYALFIWTSVPGGGNIKWTMLETSDGSTAEEAAMRQLIDDLVADAYHFFGYVNYDESLTYGFRFPKLSDAQAAASDMLQDRNRAAIASFTYQYSYCASWWQSEMLNPPFPYKGYVLAQFDINDVTA